MSKVIEDILQKYREGYTTINIVEVCAKCGATITNSDLCSYGCEVDGSFHRGCTLQLRVRSTQVLEGYECH